MGGEERGEGSSARSLSGERSPRHPNVMAGQAGRGGLLVTYIFYGLGVAGLGEGAAGGAAGRARTRTQRG